MGFRGGGEVDPPSSVSWCSSTPAGVGLKTASLQLVSFLLFRNQNLFQFIDWKPEFILVYWMEARFDSSLKNANQNLFQLFEWKPEFISVYWMETRIYSSLLNGNQNLFQFIKRKPEYIPVYWMVWLWVCLYEKNMSLK